MNNGQERTLNLKKKNKIILAFLSFVFLKTFPPIFFKDNSVQLITGDSETLIFLQRLPIKVITNGKQSRLSICYKKLD